MTHWHYCKYFPDGVDQQNFLLPDARSHWVPSRDIALTHVFLDLEVELEAKRLHGEAHLEFGVIKRRVENVFFDARELKIQRVLGQKGQDLEFNQEDRGVRVRLRPPLQRGAAGKVRLEYSAEEPRLGLYFTGPDEQYPEKTWQVWSQGQDEDNRYWFPCVDHPREKVTRNPGFRAWSALMSTARKTGTWSLP